MLGLLVREWFREVRLRVWTVWVGWKELQDLPEGTMVAEWFPEDRIKVCMHPDCDDVCVPPVPRQYRGRCPTCDAETDHEDVHDPWGIPVLARCLVCGDVY